MELSSKMTEGLKSEALFFEIYFFEKIPPSCRNGNPPPFTREAVFRKKTDEEFESLQTNSYIQKEKAQRKNPCAFSGAEGETRRVFTRRVRFANSLFYVPFCSAKRRTKSSSLSKQIHIYKKKKHKGKILVLFLAQKERLELSRRLPDLRP